MFFTPTTSTVCARSPSVTRAASPIGYIITDGRLLFPAARKAALSYTRFFDRALTVGEAVAYDLEWRI